MSGSVFPCLWFEREAEEAVAFYVSLFPGSHIISTVRQGEAGPGAPGEVLTVSFELDGRRFLAVNGGADFPFTEAVSMVAECDDQAGIDHLWERLGEGGTPLQCGWIKDGYGLHWQVVPRRLGEMMTGEPDRAERVMAAVLGMVKLDLAALERAWEGAPGG